MINNSRLFKFRFFRYYFGFIFARILYANKNDCRFDSKNNVLIIPAQKNPPKTKPTSSYSFADNCLSVFETMKYCTTWYPVSLPLEKDPPVGSIVRLRALAILKSVIRRRL